MKKILLIEPKYRNKYPPMGLMKIATYHRLLGDDVTFFKGNDPILRKLLWDKIYITSLFTFYWNSTVKTINYYSKGNVKPIVGGILASLMPNKVEEATGIKPYIGPLYEKPANLIKAIASDRDLKTILDEIKINGLDALPPDYSIFDDTSVPYKNILKESYFLRTTRGCQRGCNFCSVKTLEPKYINRIRLTPIINYIIKTSGEKCNLILLDDNLLLSQHFDSIIDEIRDLGFQSGSLFKRRKRKVDYNQGLDIRLLKKKHIKKLSTIALYPLRLAFDDLNLYELYKQKIRWALDYGLKEISSYLLFNYKDTPSDLYKRLIIASSLNEERKSRIYSFPMKYAPSTATDRSNISNGWSKRQIRGVQCILNATHGIVPTKPSFIKRAFGQTQSKFLRIIQMPENYIIYRDKYTSNGEIDDWERSYKLLSRSEKNEFIRLIAGGKGTVPKENRNVKINDLLRHYQSENRI